MVHAVLSDISRTNPDKEREWGQYHYQQSHLLGLPTSVQRLAYAWQLICTVTGSGISSQDLKPRQKKQSINAPCSTLHITTYYHNAMLDIHGDNCAALRLKTLTENFRDKNFEL